MTKRQFDQQTKRNYGGHMPSDTAEGYREDRCLPNPRYGWSRGDRLERKVQVKRERGDWNREGFALTMGSRLRAWYKWNYLR